MKGGDTGVREVIKGLCRRLEDAEKSPQQMMDVLEVSC